MTSFLFIGFLLGMRHAMEADHVAAVASLVTKTHSVQDAIKYGFVWALGHTLTLLIVGVIFLNFETVMPERFAHYLELAVGIMLVILGADVLNRLFQENIHFHVHRHDNGTVHYHAHTHRVESIQDPVHLQHTHKFPFRALLVGIVHGAAGSAVLILLVLDTLKSPVIGMIYIAIFGIGSCIGMGSLSIAIAVPLRYSATNMIRLYSGLQVLTGLSSVTIGLLLIFEFGMIERVIIQLR